MRNDPTSRWWRLHQSRAVVAIRHAVLYVTSQHRPCSNMRSRRRPKREECYAFPTLTKCIVRAPKGPSCSKHKTCAAGSSSLSTMAVSSLPGITKASSRLLCTKGFNSVRSLVGKLEQLGQDKLCLVNWLVSAGYMKRPDAVECYKSLKNWSEWSSEDMAYETTTSDAPTQDEYTATDYGNSYGDANCRPTCWHHCAGDTTRTHATANAPTRLEDSSDSRSKTSHCMGAAHRPNQYQ